MKIRDVAKKDYAQLIVHCKNVLNYNKFFNVYNENLHNRMAMYWLHKMFLDINYGKVIEYNGLIVGVLLAHIPNYKLENVFNEVDLQKLNHLEHSNINSMVALDENQTEIKNLELYTHDVHKSMFEKYHELVTNNAQILLFSILPKHRGRGLSNILFNRFKYDIIEFETPYYCLFTTTLCDYQYYEHKKMQFVKEIMFDESNTNTIMAEFLELPVYSIIYYSDARYPEGYDPVVEEIIAEQKN